jgi:WD40 repeat protein/class 3 adenylate cyclase/energy-coupling factor transporter ATP-binding protein EcfA2
MGDAPEQVLFRVLGPFEVLVAGRAEALGGARQRLVLAGLVAHANAVVSNDRLVDMVWGDEPPDTALTTVQKYVHRLRAALGDRILTRSPGYLLRVDDGESDVSRFERLLVDASQLTTAGELGDAMAAFDAALGLWRGPAWGEFADFDFARAEVARLEGLRATAIEDRTEVALAAGHHTGVIGELEATVDRYPLRERPRAQLMLALYRSGRHADALRAYEAFRRYLGEEVGLEPSASLAQLNDAIVLQKPELDWTPPPGARGRAALPSGTVTFLFSDIEGSTRLFRQVGHSYVDLLERHRRLVRAAVATAGGVEVNSEGDGLFFAFSSAAAALAASLAAQQALVAEAWPPGAEVRVRMGLHTGEAAPHDGDYVAIAVHQAARVRDAAHGGQVLLSQTTAGAIGDAVPGECSVAALGTFPLKDFEHGVELFEARHPALARSFPAPRVDGAARRVPQLPAPLAADSEPLVGRTSELEWLEVLWQRALGGDGEAALVYGPPGIGKSRLVAEFARGVHARGATVTLSVPAAPGGPVLTVLDDFDGSMLPAPGAGVLVLAAARQPVPGTANARDLRGLTADEVGLLLAHKIEAVTLDLTGAVHTETHGNPGQVHDVARRLCDREAEERVQRALDRVGSVTEEARQLRSEIAGGVLRRERLAALADERVAVGVCPYKGLAPFEAADAAFFYGRERLVATLVARIGVDRFVGIIGASGSGKSSLVRAGLLPALSAGALPGSGMWPTCTFTPGEHPCGSFAQALAPLAGVPGPELARRLDRQPDELAGVLEAAVRGRDGARVVVVVDQFEEIATLCRDQDEQERFAAALVDAVTDPAVPAVVVPVVRADYHRALTIHPELARLFEQSQLLVGAMGDADLRRAITEPARRAGLVVEDGLVDAVCSDAGLEPGALPLVSTAMAETWVRREDRVMLMLAGYRDAGGVHGALARLADDVYSGLDPGGQAQARRLFQRLAEPGEGNDDVRRRMPRSEVGGEDANAVLDAFIGRRLLVADSESVEVAHEALLREWPRLREWLEEDRAGRRVHRQLTEASAAWEGDGRDAGALYRGARLANAEEWAATHPDDPNLLEREFLLASGRAHESDVRAARRTARRLRLLAAGLTALLVVALLAGGLALVQRHNASHQASRARAAAVSAEIDRVVALTPTMVGRDRIEAGLLAAAAARLRPGPDTRGALLTSLLEEPRLRYTIGGGGADLSQLALLGNDTRAVAYTNDGVEFINLRTRRVERGFNLQHPTAVAVTKDGRLIAAGSEDGTVVLWDAAANAPDGHPMHFGTAVGGLAYSPDGRTLAVALGPPGIEEPVTPTNTTQLVDVASRRTILRLGGHAATNEAVTFSPDGKEVVTGGNDGLVITYDVMTGRAIGMPIDYRGGVARLAVSPDGHYLVVSGSAINIAPNQPIATAYDRVTGAVVKIMTGNISEGSLSFDRDGRRLVIAGLGGLQVFDVPSFAEHGGPADPQHGVASAVFLNSGLLAVSGTDGTITVWGPDDIVASGRAIPGSPNRGGAFSPDGALLALIGTDDTVAVYRTSDLTRLGTVSVGAAGQRGPVLAADTPMAFAPDSRTLVVGDRFGRVRFFDATSLQPLSPPIQVASATVTTVEYSPTGNTVLVTSGLESDNGVHILNVSARTSRLLEPGVGLPIQPAFSPNGKWLLVPSAAGTVVEYPVVDGVPGRGRLVNLPDTQSVAFSPDSHMIATGTPQGAIELFDSQTLRLIAAPIPVSSEIILPGVFSPDGRYLSTDDLQQRIRIVDVSQRAVLGATLIGNTDTFGDESFSPDSRTLVLPGPTGSVLADLDVTTWLVRACERAGRDLTDSEIAQYFSAAPHAHACAGGSQSQSPSG